MNPIEFFEGSRHPVGVESCSDPEHELIRVVDTTLGYGSRIILEELNFTVHSGEIVTILGESGGGKSTLLKALIGLLPPNKGTIFVCGEEITGTNSARALSRIRRHIGVLFQSGALLGSFTVRENVAFPIQEFTDVGNDLVEEIVKFKLGLVGLSDYADYYPSELSGGMRKRAALARAMALDPRILFCDEPSAGLDPITAAEMDALLIELNTSLGITMVVITHELPSIEKISHRSILLNGAAKGIIAVGDPKVLKESSTDPRVRAFFRRQVM